MNNEKHNICSRTNTVIHSFKRGLVARLLTYTNRLTLPTLVKYLVWSCHASAAVLLHLFWSPRLANYSLFRFVDQATKV